MRPTVAPKPVTRYNVLDDVHIQVADDVRALLKKHRLDYRAVNILSQTQVETAIP